MFVNVACSSRARVLFVCFAFVCLYMFVVIQFCTREYLLTAQCLSAHVCVRVRMHWLVRVQC